jgi:hypothetical protein
VSGYGLFEVAAIPVLGFFWIVGNGEGMRGVGKEMLGYVKEGRRESFKKRS